MTTASLRRKPRVLLNIPALLRLTGGHELCCCLKNASLEGLGVEISSADFKKIESMALDSGEVYWAPVPSLPLQRWPVKIKRLIGTGLGLELQRTKISGLQAKVLERLIHFHLK